jgi:hypothetical protein
MDADYVRSAVSLYRALQDFCELLQREKQNEPALETERRRLQTIVTQMESLGKDPGEAWQSLTITQRWGYLRLISCLGTATHLLGEGSHGEAHIEGPVRAGRRNSFNS